MQQAASMFGVDIQAKGMGLWDVGARGRDDQSSRTPPNCMNTVYNVILAILL